ncbi:MAG: hypothetical protein ABIX46_13060 [Burkholderiaceae bacterium]
MKTRSLTLCAATVGLIVAGLCSGASGVVSRKGITVTESMTEGSGCQ